MKHCSVWIGYDIREHDAFRVAQASIARQLSAFVPIHALVLSTLQARGLYWRRTSTRVNASGHQQLWDEVSGWWMSTEFAISRFLVPCLARTGWSLFVDCDVMARCDLMELFALADDRYAIMCVKHEHAPSSASKMDGQVQSAYPRKNWSSVVLFNCDHEANKRALTPVEINHTPGRDLHRFRWLSDDLIGDLPPEFNHLVGEVDHDPDAKIVHWTNGGPWIPEYADAPFSDEWRAVLASINGG